MSLISKKSGDTLIEVMFAVGIFSLIAIAVVATMNSGTSSIQSTLESTMARNEIDAQAEALRYIHSSYIAEREKTGSGTYTAIWNNIISHANDAGVVSSDSVSSCETLYKGDIYNKKAFILNTRALNDTSKAVIAANANNNLFKRAAIYPRILFSNDNSNDNLLQNNTPTDIISSVEGIYIIAVKDNENTTIITNGSNQVTAGAAYYDFYIHTCWDKTNAETASNTATVIRLYDPTVGVVNFSAITYLLEYAPNGGIFQYNLPETEVYTTFDKNHTFTLTDQVPTRSGYDFLGYQIGSTEYMHNTTTLYFPGDKVTLTEDASTAIVYPVWGHLQSITAKVDKDSHGMVSISNKYVLKAYTEDQRTGTDVTVLAPVEDTVTVRVAEVNTGYVFSDWYQGDSFRSNERNYSFAMPNSKITLIARFSHDVTTIEKIRVLNVYPTVGDNLKSWMESNGYGKVNSKQVINVKKVSIANFNSSPYSYPINDYDVIVFGFWDCNSSTDISSNASKWMTEWTKQKKPAIFGHDTIANTNSCGIHTYFNKLASYAGVDVSSYNSNWSNTGNNDSTVTIMKDSTFTKYPWNIGNAGKNLSIPASHDLAQIVVNTDNIFLKFKAQSAASRAKDNFYLVVNGTGAMIQTGHSNGKATDEEQKILANLIFYLYSQYIDL